MASSFSGRPSWLADQLVELDRGVGQLAEARGIEVEALRRHRVEVLAGEVGVEIAESQEVAQAVLAGAVTRGDPLELLEGHDRAVRDHVPDLREITRAHDVRALDLLLGDPAVVPEIFPGRRVQLVEQDRELCHPIVEGQANTVGIDRPRRYTALRDRIGELDPDLHRLIDALARGRRSRGPSRASSSERRALSR